MQPIFEKINLKEHESMHTHIAVHPFLETPLHYHPEAEIIYIDKSYGTRIVGDSIQSFSQGDLVMVGSGVPHVWRNDAAFYKGEKDLEAKVHVMHFDENFWGETFSNLPEMDKMRRLFKLAKRGIQFVDKSAAVILGYFDSIFKQNGQERIITFINMLHYISNIKQYNFLMEAEYHSNYNQADCDKISKVYEYLLKNYTEEIDFQKLASLVNMSLPSLCRFFKQRAHRQITMALNEIRISQSCKLLSDDRYSATQVCYMVGYGNYSHFNEQFKKITGYTPLKYKKKFE